MQLSNLDEQFLQLALQEDLGWPYLDLTSETIFQDEDRLISATIISKQTEPFIVCGLFLLPAFSKLFSEQFKYTLHCRDGDWINPRSMLLSLQGPAKIVLMLERTLLNFLQHLSGVATTTRLFVDKIQQTKLKILDTRKTVPGFRRLDKYAVQCGGGLNHRMGLYDAILIKDNHIDAVGGVAEVIKRLPKEKKYQTIIEIRTIPELEIVLAQGFSRFDRVLLDNMDLKTLQQAVQLCKGKIATEASGNINLNTVVHIAETGVDFASVGQLTHSPMAIDLSMVM